MSHRILVPGSCIQKVTTITDYVHHTVQYSNIFTFLARYILLFVRFNTLFAHHDMLFICTVPMRLFVAHYGTLYLQYNVFSMHLYVSSTIQYVSSWYCTERKDVLWDASTAFYIIMLIIFIHILVPQYWFGGHGFNSLKSTYYI